MPGSPTVAANQNKPAPESRGMATAIALVTHLPHLIPFTLQFITYCILVSAFLCSFPWFTYPITCFCYPCDPLAWPFNPQLFRLHPSLCCSAAVPSAALYLSFSFQHVKTSNCFIHLLIRFLQCSASPQCTLLLPTCCTAALDVLLAILWRICASLRAFKTSKTPPAQAWALRTISKAAVLLPVCAFSGFDS